MDDAPTKVTGGFPMVEDDRGAALFRHQVMTLQQNILTVVKSEVAEFHQATGLTPRFIDIEMVETDRGRVPGDISITFKL